MNERHHGWRGSRVVETAEGKCLERSKQKNRESGWGEKVNSGEHDGCSWGCTYNFAQIVACEFYYRASHVNRQNNGEDEKQIG
eukprot:6202144-Pleurochrysis_carterae.AAC.1